MKNEQWVLEPFADMVVSFSVMNIGVIKFNQLTDSIKKNYTLPILRCSLSRHLDIIFSKTKHINNFIYDEIKSKQANKKLDSNIQSFNWYVDTISLEQSIYETFEKFNGKYYLD